jgi:hypothetical protein
MMYGEEIHETIDSSANLNAAATTAVLTKRAYVPGALLYWGIKVGTVFALTGAGLVEGLLTLYRYTRTIQTAVLGNAGGTLYAVGDLLSVTQTGASGGIIRVASITAATGAVLTYEIVNPGINYHAASNLATVALTGSGSNVANVTITDQKALDTMKLVNGMISGKHYVRRVPNAIPDTSPAGAPPASYKVGEDLVIYITTAAVAGAQGAETGDYLPFILWQNRGENFAAQGLWVETAVGVAVSPAVPNY